MPCEDFLWSPKIQREFVAVYGATRRKTIFPFICEPFRDMGLIGGTLALSLGIRRSTMKLFLPLSVLVLLGIFTPNMFADPVLTINAGVGAGVLTETVVGSVDTWTYLDDSTTVLNGLGSQTDNDLLTVVFSDALGVPLLSVTDACINVSVLEPVNPCAGFAFSDTALGTPYLISGTGDLANLDLALGADVNVGALGVDLAGVDIGSGSASIGFNNPPPSVTPEPSALTLLGTGLLGLAGAVKRKYYA
jgi:hypothetical protein